jgi:hypothetical protein
MAAVPRLRKALQNEDAEVLSRTREVLELILDDYGRLALRSFENAIEKAPSVHVVSSALDVKEPKATLSVDASLLRKPGGKIRVTSKGSHGGEAWKGFLVSDGERMMLETEARAYGQKAWGYDGKDYWPTVRAAAAGTGAFHSTHIWAYVRLKDTAFTDLFRFGAWKEGEDGKLRTLEYSIRWIGEPDFPFASPIGAKVWYEPDTFRPIKRVLSFSRLQDGPGVIEEFGYGIDIPEERFRVPEGKAR